MWYALVKTDDTIRQFVRGDTVEEAQAQSRNADDRIIAFVGEPRSGAIFQAGDIVWPDPTLAALKLARLADAASYRNRRQNEGCVTALGRVDTDFSRSIPIINSFAAAAGASIAAKTAFGSKKFGLADGTEVTIGATQGAALGLAVNAFLDQCQQAYRAVKTQINAAASPDAIAAVDIAAGYPA